MNSRFRSMSTASGRASGLLLAAAAITLVAGCPDPAGKFDDFAKRTADFRDIQEEDISGGQLSDVSGTFLFAITPAPISQDFYLQFLSINTFEANDEGGGTLSMTLKPLVLDLQSTDSPRTVMEGNDIVIPDIAVAADGSFTADLGEVSVPGTANPISGGTIVANLQLEGSIRSENFVCGKVTGAVSQPITAALNGSFGSERVDEGAATDPTLFPTGADIKGSCAAGGIVEPEPDAGGEEGGPDADAGEGGPDVEPGEDVETDTTVEPTVACTEEDLAGTYDLQFKTDAQTSPSDVRLILTASGDDNCYTGVVEAKSDGSKLADVTKARLEEGTLVVFLLDFQIPPGQTALLPNGGVADVTLTASQYTPDSMCGSIVFGLKEPFALESAGGFAAGRVGSQVVVNGPSCEGLDVPQSEDCPAQDLTGDWDTFFKTTVQANASSVIMRLEKHPTLCYTGKVVSKTTGDDIATVKSFVKIDGGAYFVEYLDFIIPPGANPILPNGGVADVELTVNTIGEAGISMCGDIFYKLKSPFETTSAGTFASALNESGATVDGHTCDDITLP